MFGDLPLGERFLLGVNYWPRSTAMAMWSRFDASEIDEDFARIAGLGFDVIRFFLMWEVFQPARAVVSERSLAHLETILDCAGRHRLRTMPTLFTGHMSGVNWLPAWTLDEERQAGRFRTIANACESPYGIGDFYRGELLDAQRLFAQAVGKRARHPSVLAWDLGNEFSNLRAPASAANAAHWSATLSRELRSASGLPVTGGTHGEDLTEDRNLRLSSMCAPWAFATMHGYPAYSAFARSVDDPDVVPFLAGLTRAFSGRRVLFSEFGNPACPPNGTMPCGMGCLEEEPMARYATSVLERLWSGGALGAFWWCWTDYAANLAETPPFDRAPHELCFGIVRADGSEKPVARALAEFARRGLRVVTPPEEAPIAEDSYYAGLPASSERAYRDYVLGREGRAVRP